MPMDATPRSRTPIPPRPVVTSAAMDSTHRLLAALIDRDLIEAEALFEPTACVWFPSRGGLASVEGAEALTRALLELLETSPPTRLAVIGGIGGSTITSAYLDDAIAWTLEIQLHGERITGALLRGAQLH